MLQNNFITHNEAKLESATMGAGSVVATYPELVALFGEPYLTEDDCIKNEVEWMIRFDDGEIGIIYDWKVCTKYLGSNGIPIEQVEEWEIGSQSGTYVFQDRIKELIENKRK